MSKTRKTRVLIAEDKWVAREALLNSFSRYPDRFEVTATASARDALSAASNQPPDVALIDLELPDSSGFELTRELLSRFPESSVIVVSVHKNREKIFRALDAGAKGYIAKDLIESREDIVQPVEIAASGQTPGLSPRLVQAMAEEARERERLTPREVEVVRLMSAGASNREIATQLQLAGQSVKNYVTKIKDKLGATDREEMIEVARELGLLGDSGAAAIDPQ